MVIMGELFIVINVNISTRGTDLSESLAMEGNPLELALVQLAKTMGVALPNMPPTVQSEQNTSTESAEVMAVISAIPSPPQNEIEDGELSDTQPLLKTRASPKRQNVKPIPSAKRRATSTFTGDIDAESLLRGPQPPKTKRPRPEIVSKTSEPRQPKVPCRYFMEGKCTKGTECTFSHAIKPNVTQQEARTTEVCRFHMAGNCLKGEGCLWSHDLSKVPCKFWHVKGECAAEANCRFSHGPISETERHALFAEMMGARDPRLAPPSQPGMQIPTPRPIIISPPPIVARPIAPKMILDPLVEKFNPLGSPF
jgi:hypothetical protein